MNKSRRNQLKEAVEKIKEAQGIIESVKDEEDNAFDNLPESLQEGENGRQMEINVSELEDIYDNLDKICDDILRF